MYRLYVNGGGPAPLISFEDPVFWHNHFLGKPELPAWTPPAVHVAGKSKPLKDMLMGSFQAPFVSEKFRIAMFDLIAPHVEFLPLVQLRKMFYCVMNVVEVVDCLDVNKSDILYACDEPGKILHIRKHVFKPIASALPPIFKVPEDEGNIFVTPPFVEVVKQAKLSGIGVDDPADIRLVKGDSPVEGLPT